MIISLNIGGGGCIFTGDCVSEFSVGCIQVDGVDIPPTTKGVAFTDAGKWKTQGRGGSCPIKRDRGTKTSSTENASSVGGGSTVTVVKPVWVNSLLKKVSPVCGISKKTDNSRVNRAQEASTGELANLKKTGPFTPMGSVMNKKLSLPLPVPVVLRSRNLILAEVPADWFIFDWCKCYIDSCATYHTLFIEKFLGDVRKERTTINGSCNAGRVSTSTKGWYGKFEVWLNTKEIANLSSHGQ